MVGKWHAEVIAIQLALHSPCGLKVKASVLSFSWHSFLLLGHQLLLQLFLRGKFLTIHLGMPETKILIQDGAKCTASEVHGWYTRSLPHPPLWGPQSHTACHTLHSQENRTSPSHYCPEVAESRSCRKNIHLQNSQLFSPLSLVSQQRVMNVSKKTLKLWEIKVATWHTGMSVNDRQWVSRQPHEVIWPADVRLACESTAVLLPLKWCVSAHGPLSSSQPQPKIPPDLMEHRRRHVSVRHVPK